MYNFKRPREIGFGVVTHNLNLKKNERKRKG